MENLLYVLLGILWVAYSLYSAKQKTIQKQKKLQNPDQEPSSSSPLPIPGSEGKSVFDEIIRELTGNPGSIQQKAEPVKQEQPNRSVLIHEFNKPIDDFEHKKTISEPLNIQPGNIITKEVFESKEIEVKFDLRQAVIFSELLNRKYF